MSAFTPTQSILDPPQRPEQLGAAVMQSLSRPIGKRNAWGASKSLVLGGLSFGLWPLLSWPLRFGQFITAEQEQFWHLTEWLRIRGGAKAVDLQKNIVRNIGSSPTLWLFPLIAAVLILHGFLYFSHYNGNLVQAVLSSTYGHKSRFFLNPGWDDYILFPRTPGLAHVGWSTILFIAFTSHWLHVRQHAAAVKRSSKRLNESLASLGIAPVQLRGNRSRFGLMWVAVAVAGVLCNAWWAIPAAAAGYAQQRYMRDTSLRIRTQFAQRIHTLLTAQRPPVAVYTPPRLREHCRNPLCRSNVADAAFCPRCGTRVERAGSVA